MPSGGGRSAHTKMETASIKSMGPRQQFATQAAANPALIVLRAVGRGGGWGSMGREVRRHLASLAPNRGDAGPQARWPFRDRCLPHEAAGPIRTNHDSR